MNAESDVIEKPKTKTTGPVHPTDAEALLDSLIAIGPSADGSVERDLRHAIRTLKERAEEAERCLEPTLKWMNFEDGKLDMALAGKAVESMALMITEWFRGNGAQNYVDMTIHDVHDPAVSYSFMVQKHGDGAKTPHQLRKDAEARAEALEVQLREVTDAAAKTEIDQSRVGSFVEADLAAALHSLNRLHKDVLLNLAGDVDELTSDLAKIFDVINHHAAKLSISRDAEKAPTKGAASFAHSFQRSWEDSMRNFLGLFGIDMVSRDVMEDAVREDQERLLGMITILSKEVSSFSGKLANAEKTIADLKQTNESLSNGLEAEGHSNWAGRDKLAAAERKLANLSGNLTALHAAARHLVGVHADEAAKFAGDKTKEGFGNHRFHEGASGGADALLDLITDIIDVPVAFPESDSIQLTKAQIETLRALHASGEFKFVNYGRGCGVNRSSAMVLQRLGLADVIPEIKSGVTARITRWGSVYYERLPK